MSLTNRCLERQPTAADKLEQALRAADEGEPTFATLEAISRSLVAANSDLEAVAVDFDTRPRATERIVNR